ncbi:MAG: hypothetical protein DLM72_08410 [Candidatus Nitrosopolaris wilkensis]|nr:MAG: hypothetical protein DLM72_08410 [Candidatus Nitrosopolaris wilkensis]
MVKATIFEPVEPRSICKETESGSFVEGNQAEVFTGNQARDDSRICDAVGCSAQATTTIELKAGHLGTIRLSICKDCVSKFVGDE